MWDRFNVLMSCPKREPSSHIYSNPINMFLPWSLQLLLWSLIVVIPQQCSFLLETPNSICIKLMLMIIVSNSSSVVHARASLCSEISIDQFLGNILVDSTVEQCLVQHWVAKAHIFPQIEHHGLDQSRYNTWQCCGRTRLILEEWTNDFHLHICNNASRYWYINLCNNKQYCQSWHLMWLLKFMRV